MISFSSLLAIVSHYSVLKKKNKLQLSYDFLSYDDYLHMLQDLLHLKCRIVKPVKIHIVNSGTNTTLV